MNREQKAAAIAEIAENIREAEAVFAVDYRGLSVPQANELRSRLRDAGARFTIVKNTLTERAADEAGAETLKELLEGPTALTFVRGDAAAAAKALRDYGRQTDLLPFKGGFMDGNALSAEDIVAIARLPSREVLYAQLVGIVAHPISGLARTLNQLIGGLAVALGQIQEKGLVPAEGAASGAADDSTGDDAPAAPAGEEAAEVPTEGAVEPTDAADDGPGGSAEGAGADEPDPDAGPASEPEPAQPDQAEGDDDSAEAGS
jgi:large subunit ribosomal protein L10